MQQSKKTREEAQSKVAALLEKMPLLDGHNDLAMVIRDDPVAQGDVLKFRLDQRHDTGDTDIPRLREGKVSAQIWAAFVESDYDRPARKALEQIDLIRRMQDAHPDVFAPILRADDILEAKRQGKIGSMIAVEGGVGLENSLSPLRIWYAAGARLLTLCHNGTLDWVDSATDQARHGGLTAFGREVVRELNRLGMIVDCAHVSPDVMRQVLDISTAPIVFSHSNARALCDHKRNVPDDVLERVPANDGLVMAAFIPQFISEEVRRWLAPMGTVFGGNVSELIEAHARVHGPSPKSTVEQLADHVEYIADKVGAGRVGIGSDFYGGSTTPVGLEDVSRFPNLLVEMVLRGWSDDRIAGLAGLNFLRVFRAVEAEGKRLRETRPAPVGSVATLDPSPAPKASVA
jgi:membrane dipeptidase